MLNKSDESGHPCLVPDLRNFHFPVLDMILPLGLLYVASFMLKYISSILGGFFFLVFIINGC